MNSTKNSTLKIIFLTLFLDIVGFSIIFPLFPAILDYYLINNSSNIFLSWIIESLTNISISINHNNPKFITTIIFGGVLSFIYSILQFIFSPIWGSLSDIYGRKKILLITVLGLSISYLLWGFSFNFWMLLIARLIGGIMGGNISVASAVIADITSKDNRVSGMAIIGIAFGLGFIVGPAIGGFIGQINLLEYYPKLEKIGVNPFTMTAFFSLTLSLINLFLLKFKFKESLSKKKYNKIINLFKIVNIFDYKSTINKKINFIYLLYLIAISGLEFTITFLAVDLFKFSVLQNGLMFVYIGLILILTQGLLLRKLCKRYDEIILCIVGLIFSLICFLLMSQINAKSIILLFISLSLMSISIGLTLPSMSSLVSICSKKEDQGSIMGIFRSTGSFARAIGPLIYSIIYFYLGPNNAYLVGATIIFITLFYLLKNIPYKIAQKFKSI